MAKQKSKPSHSAGKKTTRKPSMDKESLGNDYWDRVADDAASGYENKEDKNDILNVDQLPGDNERGDKETDTDETA